MNTLKRLCALVAFLIAVLGTGPAWADLSDDEMEAMALEMTPVVVHRMCDVTAGAEMGNGEYDVISTSRLVVEMIVQAVEQSAPLDGMAAFGGEDCWEIDEDELEGEIDGIEYAIEVEDLEVCESDGEFTIWIDSASLDAEGGFLEDLDADLDGFHLLFSEDGLILVEIDEFSLQIEFDGGEIESDLDGYFLEIEFGFGLGFGFTLDIDHHIEEFSVSADADFGSLDFEIEDFEFELEVGDQRSGIPDFEIFLGFDEVELDLEFDDFQLEIDIEDAEFELEFEGGNLFLVGEVEEFDLEVEIGDDEFEVEIEDFTIVCDPVPNCDIDFDTLVLNPVSPFSAQDPLGP